MTVSHQQSWILQVGTSDIHLFHKPPSMKHKWRFKLNPISRDVLGASMVFGTAVIHHFLAKFGKPIVCQRLRKITLTSQGRSCQSSKSDFSVCQQNSKVCNKVPQQRWFMHFQPLRSGDQITIFDHSDTCLQVPISSGGPICGLFENVVDLQARKSCDVLCFLAEHFGECWGWRSMMTKLFRGEFHLVNLKLDFKEPSYFINSQVNNSFCACFTHVRPKTEEWTEDHFCISGSPLWNKTPVVLESLKHKAKNPVL